MKARNLLTYGVSLLTGLVIYCNALAQNNNVVTKDTRVPIAYYTTKQNFTDQEVTSEFQKTWGFNNVLTSNPVSGIELFLNDASYGISNQNGEVKPTGIEEIVEQQKIPKQPYLRQNYPNPFNPETKIEYGLPRKSHVKLEVYNLLGQRVTTLIDKEQSPGVYTIKWDGKTDNNRELSSGLYFYRLTFDYNNGNKELTRKMILIK